LIPLRARDYSGKSKQAATTTGAEAATPVAVSGPSNGGRVAVAPGGGNGSGVPAEPAPAGSKVE
ncbi:MAG TPA: hypothetical protein VM536_07520, partial [Chloroflexia bacterium]|nr:hypothetical protein [Chloroflexia bacterium]